eukprot:COSAG01_NODE_22367_length_858_cov_1.747036_1_plen_164_part_00
MPGCCGDRCVTTSVWSTRKMAAPAAPALMFAIHWPDGSTSFAGLGRSFHIDSLNSVDFSGISQPAGQQIGRFVFRSKKTGLLDLRVVHTTAVVDSTVRVRLYRYSRTAVRPWSVRTDLRRSQHATVQLHRAVLYQSTGLLPHCASSASPQRSHTVRQIQQPGP